MVRISEAILPPYLKGRYSNEFTFISYATFQTACKVNVVFTDTLLTPSIEKITYHM